MADKFEFYKKYCFTRNALGISANAIHEEIIQVWADSSPKLPIIYEWIRKIKNNEFEFRI